MNLEEYRRSESEQARTADLMRIMPRGRQTVLEIGAREGFFSRMLIEHFQTVTALDLEKPKFDLARVNPVEGNVTRLDFPDSSFDCVVCTEVLEHVAELQKAADEITRVAKHEVIIGVPYRQDTRLGRTTCSTCGKNNPPWGHVNTFNELDLKRLFNKLRMVETSFVWQNRNKTNRFSAWLMDLSGNPWGTYHQDEPCVHCGTKLTPPEARTASQRALSATAMWLNQLQSLWVRPWPNWIHMVFQKSDACDGRERKAPPV